MNRQEFEDTAKRYREELFRMYAGQNLSPPPRPQGGKPVPPPPPPRPQGGKPVPPPPPPHPQGGKPVPPPPPLRPQGGKPVPPPPPPRPQGGKPVPPPPPPRPQGGKPVPPPPPPRPQGGKPVPPLVLPVQANLPDDAALSEADAQITDTAEPDTPALPKRAYTGEIRVHAVTAEGARPVPGAAVTVVRFTGGEPELIALRLTDDSGETDTMTVPAPPPSADQRRPASFLYDISVQADGYYREHSTDVPVFPGVTSVQTFVLIPLPEGGEPLSGGDFTYYNNMQQF